MFGVKVLSPEIKGIKEWINSKPLKIKDLKDKVVLIEFWSYNCINCRRTIPYMKKWHSKYSKKGLVVIGIHSPEFEFEKDPKNVKKAVKDLGIKYPIAVDSKLKTWDNFENRVYPAKFLIEEGYVTFVLFGEGDYEKTERVIQEALGVKGKLEKEKYLSYMFDQSPITYAGYAKNTGLGSGLMTKGKTNYYVDPGDHMLNTVYPDGHWDQKSDCLELKKAPGKLSYRFIANEVSLIVEPLEKSVTADVYVDYKKKKTVKINSSGICAFFRDKAFREREISIIFNGKVKVFTFTFG